MFKKWIWVTLLFGGLFLVGCDKNTEVELPNLNHASKVQAMEKMDQLGLKIVMSDEVNNKVQPGLFSRYEPEFKMGDKVKKGTEITVFFALNKNTLPNLNGLNKTQAATEFTFVNFNTEFIEIESSEAEEGTFLYYQNYEIGTELPIGTNVKVFFALKPFPEKNNLIISKYVEGRTGNKAIELYNGSTIDLDLANFPLGIYVNGALTPTEFVELEVMLAPEETYLIVDEGSDAALKEKADFIHDLPFDGNDAVAIHYRNEVLDVVGIIGNGIYHIHNVTLVRDASISNNNNTYLTSEWNEYAKDNYTMVKEHPVIYPTEFFITEEWKDKDYFTEDGGVALVTYAFTNDGDTTNFEPHFMNNSRIRYVGVDTPEMSSPGVEGQIAAQAKGYTHSKLSGASTIYVQYDPSSGRFDTYSRNLGLVWYDGRLLNYELVLMGYSQNNYSDPDQFFIYEGIPLEVWFKNAETHAKNNRLGIWGM